MSVRSPQTPVDVTIAQATIALLSLSRITFPAADTVNPVDGLDEIPASATQIDSCHTGAAVALIEGKVTKKSPELVEAVLQRYAAGERVGTIATALDVHHSTVRRLLNAHRQRTRLNRMT
jgi:DNA-directed RNA polymerase specialized sigma24 family protein